MKKILYIFTFLFLSLTFTNVYARDNLTPKESSDIKIHDYASLLTEEEKKEVNNNIEDFINTTKYDLVIVTIKENPYSGYDAPIYYARDFFDYNNYGKGVNRAGIIILIDMENREVIFDVSGSALLMYDDIRQKDISDLIAGHLKVEEYSIGLIKGIAKAKGDFADDIPSSNKDYCVNDNGDYYRCRKSINWLIPSIVALISAIIGSLIHLRKYKGIKLAHDANNYLVGEIKGESSDNFKFSNVTRVRKPSNSSSSGGSRGGGTSIGTGSSGRSHSSSRSRF